jgi:hypothetical protein
MEFSFVVRHADELKLAPSLDHVASAGITIARLTYRTTIDDARLKVSNGLIAKLTPFIEAGRRENASDVRVTTNEDTREGSKNTLHEVCITYRFRKQATVDRVKGIAVSVCHAAITKDGGVPVEEIKL